MGGLRLLLVAAFGATLLATVPACSSSRDAGVPPAQQDLTEPAPVPNPPPRYKHSASADPGIVLPDEDAGPQKLQIKCGGNTPYVCNMDDGSIKCSDHPCLPDCERLGCLSGETCLACDGGFRCVMSGEGC